MNAMLRKSTEAFVLSVGLAAATAGNAWLESQKPTLGTNFLTLGEGLLISVALLSSRNQREGHKRLMEYHYGS
jgi:hypothetical protein